MADLQPQPEIITIEQYEQLPEDVRVEVFDGFIYNMASPSLLHQRFLLRLANVLDSYIMGKGGECMVFIAPCDVLLSKEPVTIVQPDIMVVCDPDKLKNGKRCEGAPDFIIEIVSPSNTVHDYVEKLYYYQHFGVREYWIVDSHKQCVVVYNLEVDAADMSTYTFQDRIKVGIYDDLEIDFAEISGLLGLDN